MSFVSPESNASLVRLEHTSGYDLDRIATEIIERGEALDRAAAIVERKLSDGEYVTNRNLALLIGRSKSSSLYDAVKDRFLEQNDVEAMVLLYQAHYPDSQIEEKLSKILYKIANDDLIEGVNALMWGHILRAMRDVGSSSVLPILEAILYDKLPSLSTKRSMAKAIRSNIDEREGDGISIEEAQALLDEKQEDLFADSVSEAIAAIKERIRNVDSRKRVTPKESAQDGLDNGANISSVHPPIRDDIENTESIKNLLSHGESKTIEFKETLGVNLRTKSKDKAIEDSALKTIVAYLNTDGGVLFIGVDDDGNLKGIAPDLKLKGNSKDKLRLYFKDLVKSRIGEQFFTYINFSIVDVDGHNILIVKCKKSNNPCFLYEKEFYVRTGPASDRLEGRKTHEYIQNHFRN